MEKQIDIWEACKVIHPKMVQTNYNEHLLELNTILWQQVIYEFCESDYR